ncbi:MAG: L-lactate dehydrogenase [Polyangiales bacterium]
MKIAVVGMGAVGTSVALSTLQAGIASTLLVSDLRRERAEGEAMDLAHGAPFYPAADVHAVDLEDTLDADAIVIAAGRNGRADESRLDLLRDNAKVARDLGVRLARSRGLVVIVANPVDVLTRVVTEASGLPPSRVIGTGTLLDTARLRTTLARSLDVDTRSVHANIVGEHGDSEVALWSSAYVGGTLLRHMPGFDHRRESAIATEVRTAAYEIIRRKGMTNHAIGLATAALLRWLLRDEKRVVTVSRVQDGAFGLRDVALSLPAITGRDGVTTVLEPEMDESERAALMRSADVLQQAHASITP